MHKNNNERESKTGALVYYTKNNIIRWTQLVDKLRAEAE